MLRAMTDVIRDNLNAVMISGGTQRAYEIAVERHAEQRYEEASAEFAGFGPLAKRVYISSYLFLWEGIVNHWLVLLHDVMKAK